MTYFRIGDLVKHLRSDRIGMVMSATAPLHRWGNSIRVCQVTWVDTFKSNLMDIDLLSRV